MVYTQPGGKKKKKKDKMVPQKPVMLFKFFFLWMVFISSTIQNTSECLPGWHIVAPKSFQTLGEHS